MARSSVIVRGAALLGCALLWIVSASTPAFSAGVYLVKEGDTLAGISRLFGIEVEDLSAFNHRGGADIAPGDRIRIPEKPLQPQPLAEGAQRRDLSTDRVQQAVCRDETVYHAVVKGDTLFSISKRYSTELDNLLLLNGLRKRSRLSIGQKIVVRKSPPRSHTVARGETLSRIAARYGVDVPTIARLNQLSGETISTGQQLVIKPCDPYAAAGSAPPPLDGTHAAAYDAGGAVALATAAAPQSTSEERSSGDADSTASLAQKAIGIARTMLNVPYRFGGNTLRGIDCSAYVQRVFSLLDFKIPRTAREQYFVGARIDRDDLRVGDLVFFRTYASFPSHVGIYIGENLFIHASSVVRKVAIDSLDLPYYRKRFIGARRVVVDDAPAVASTP